MPFSSFKFLKVSRSSLIPIGSSPLIGSSNIIKSGLSKIAKATPSLCFIPKEKFLNFFFPASSKPTNFMASVICSKFTIPL